MIATICIIAYCVLSGFLARLSYDTVLRIGDCERGHDGFCLHDMASFLLGVAWPVGLPVIGGFVLAGRFTSEAVESRHERKMARLEAEREVEQLKLETTKAEINFLEKNGVRANVKGLFE